LKQFSHSRSVFTDRVFEVVNN
jgi:hypothetical protein